MTYEPELVEAMVALVRRVAKITWPYHADAPDEARAILAKLPDPDLERAREVHDRFIKENGSPGFWGPEQFMLLILAGIRAGREG